MSTMVISFFWVLTFEIPFAEIDNLIMSRGKTPQLPMNHLIKEDNSPV